MKSHLPITNRGANQIVIGLEPVGETIGLGCGETCSIEFDGSLEEISLELAAKGDVLLVYAMCEKRARISRR